MSKLKQMNKDMLFDDFDDKTNDEKAIFIFTSLCNFFRVATLTHNRSKPNWRPTRQEMRDSFLLHVDTRAVLKETLRNRQNRLSQFGFSNQPLPIIVGNANNNKECLVVFDQVKYVVETPMKAVDIAFKSYHSLHAEYPAESEQIWSFLQKAVYKFKSKWDRYIDSTEILVREFNEFV
ncbi:hypothetical protein ONE63_011552 [Megalurothrips usitatus]|uniref:Uncharacterized protein n=1 Tax=Megalurothrips usitatus TaxID=439358 RepID=A0AAV7X4A0_9NEOP|nr:hypothetical protein ONE63_011552 [Megalurothrips usitatus]